MTRFLKSAGVLLIALLPVSAFAALGGTPETFETARSAVRKPESNRAAAASAMSGSASANYSIRETAMQSGTVVREYVGNDGIVFAVAWKGPYQPDLRKLLGARHFRTMTSHAKGKPGGGKSGLAIEDSEVIIQTRGHMRSHEGKAWLPSRLPSGVTEADIQ